ncbi:NADH-quinone oxidoreductase subunit C, partial [Aliarcobacter butzleri]
PKGEYYSFSDAAYGVLGFFIVGDGSGRPYKVKCSPPCFYSLAAYSKIVVGTMIADAVVTMASMYFIAG